MSSRHLLYETGKTGLAIHHEVIGPTSIGRTEDSDIWIHDEAASASHAILIPEPNGRLFLIDLGSAHGTYVDGERRTTCRLTSGALVQIGGVTFRYLDETCDEEVLSSVTVPCGQGL